MLLHAYYVVLGIALLYGDELLSTYVDQGVAGPLRLLANLELLIFVAVFMDVARAPDCDVACGGTLLGYIAHIPVKPFLRTHRGWYHSVWAAIYMSGVASAVVAALTATVNAVSEHVGFGPVLSLVRLGATAFSASFLSYLLHLAEDSLTLRGVRWLGTRVRGPLRTGGTDIVAASIIVLTSALTTWVAYYATRSLSRGALLGALVLIAMFASMFELASSPPRRT